MTTSGYETQLAIGFLEYAGERRADGKFATINDFRVNDNNRQSIARWESADTVPLDRFDKILLAHGLMLWEFEDWAESTHGRDGFVDALGEPSNLAA